MKFKINMPYLPRIPKTSQQPSHPVFQQKTIPILNIQSLNLRWPPYMSGIHTNTRTRPHNTQTEHKIRQHIYKCFPYDLANSKQPLQRCYYAVCYSRTVVGVRMGKCDGCLTLGVRGEKKRSKD